MSITEDISAIDVKKAKEAGTTTTSPDFKGFITNYFSSIVFTIGISIFIIGGLGLYTTKVAQANILPDNIELAPYTIFDRIVKDDPIDINIMRPSFFSDNKTFLSQKAIFNSQEYLDSFNKSFLCSLKQNANPNGGFIANPSLYLSFVYDNIVANVFYCVNTIFFYLSYLPESLIMLLYGIFGVFIWFGLFLITFVLSCFYHFINIPQLFRTVSEENDKQWESLESISFLRFMKFILFFFLWGPFGLASACITPIFFTIYGLIAPLFAKYKIKNLKEEDKNITNFLYNNLVYKKFFFFILATVSLFTNGIKYLGNNAIVGIIVAVIFAYFMGLYTNEMPEPGTDGFTSKIRQHMRQCKVFERNDNDPLLVQICERIPINDEKIENIIGKGRMRELKKPTKVGGDYEDDNGENAEEIPVQQPIIGSNIHVDKQRSALPLQQIDKLKNQLSKLQNQFSELEKIEVGNQVEPIQKNSELLNIQKQIEQVQQQIQNLQGQSGGIKHKKLNNKKFNIRWT